MLLHGYAHKAVKLLSVLLLFAIAILFLAYFVITNNSYFILYSFILFIILGVLGSFSKRLYTYEIIASLAFIVAGSIFYTLKLSLDYYGIFSIAAFIVLYLLIKNKEYVIYAYSFLMLPDILYFLGFGENVNFAINTAIVGYYLLIASVISIFLAILFDESKRYAGIKNHLLKYYNNKMTYYALAAVAVIILISPIWPLGISINLNSLPHAQIILNQTRLTNNKNSTIEDLNVELNYSLYKNYTSANFSNLQFFYKGGPKINASLHQINETSAYVAILEWNKSKLSTYGAPYIYFMPYNYSNTTTKLEKPINTVNLTLGKIGNITYTIPSINKTIKVPVLSRVTNYHKTQTFVPPYYDLGSYCAPGSDITYNISLNLSSNASFFILRNTSDFLNAVGNFTGTEDSLINSFSKYSFGRFLDTKSVNTKVYTNTSCLFYAIATLRNVNANISITAKSFITVKYRNETVAEPDLYNKINDYYTGVYSYIPNAISYIKASYTAVSQNTTN